MTCKILSTPKILNKDRSKPCLFTFFHRLAQAENKCKQMDFERSLLSIFECQGHFESTRGSPDVVHLIKCASQVSGSVLKASVGLQPKVTIGRR